MIQILLITTGANRVWRKLETMNEVCLTVINLLEENRESIKNPKNKLFPQYIADINPSILITYRCPYILSSECYFIAKIGAFNIHPSLLPKYSGLNPWIDFFRNKETQGGVTIHRITNDVDAGEIIIQESFRVDPTENIDTVRDKADIIATNMLDQLLHIVDNK